MSHAPEMGELITGMLTVPFTQAAINSAEQTAAWKRCRRRVAATSSEIISRPGSPGNADNTWLENPPCGQDLRRVICVNQFPLSGRLRRAERQSPSGTRSAGQRTPSAFVMQECQPLAEEKEASLVIGHEKATSRA